MLIRFFKYNLKKNFFFFSLVLYFHFITYKILIFLRMDIMRNKDNLNLLTSLGKFGVIKATRINTSNILSIFNNYNNNKYMFTIFKRDLFFVSTNNSIILNYFNNLILLNLLIMISIDYFFINIKYLCKISFLHKLLPNNYNLYLIYFQKLYYININYLYNIISYKIFK